MSCVALYFGDVAVEGSEVQSRESYDVVRYNVSKILQKIYVSPRTTKKIDDSVHSNISGKDIKNKNSTGVYLYYKYRYGCYSIYYHSTYNYY